jgi:hypothetical protein
MKKTKISMDGKNNIHCLFCKLSQNKALEIQWGRFDESDSHWFSFEMKFDTKGDHAGFEWHNEVFRWHFRIAVYDCRHWDYDNECWQQISDVPTEGN